MAKVTHVKYVSDEAEERNIRESAKAVEVVLRTMLKLTPDEIERYAPYHTFPQFKIGYEEYFGGKPHRDLCNCDDGVGQQAYDRAAECAMRRRLAEYRKRA
jgi:hypothetical protein